jgi:phosphoribosylformylglycinamidine (FGAM) synthase PurS component
MKKYKVECQELVTFEIEAESKEEAEEKALIKITEKCLYDADGFDWCISAYESEVEVK